MKSRKLHNTAGWPFRVLFGLLLLTAAGCGTGGVDDADGGSDGGCGRETLAIVGSPTRTLHPDDQEELRVLLTASCIGPVVSETVSFEFVGDHGDTTLSSESAQTDQAGLASVSLTAGNLAKQFQVCAHHPEDPTGVHFSIQVTVTCDGHCTNGSQDCGEEGIDCGGECDPCSDPCAGHCANGVQDCEETGIDCGGECQPCGSGDHHIYGIFGWSPGAGSILSGKQGWSTEFLRSEVEWADGGWWNARMNDYAAMIAEGFTPITRLSYGPSMMPGNLSLCDGVGADDFAVRAAAMVVDIKQRHGTVARRFVIGNEPNHPAEGELEVSTYVACYLQVYQKIKAAWPGAVVIPASVAPWAPKDYNCGGNAACSGLNQPWKRYYFGLVAGVGGSADAYDMHAYGGRDGDHDPYDDGDWSFGVFEAAIQVMGLAYPNSKPIYITEFNHGANGPAYTYDGSWSGFIQRGFQRINDYNAGAGGRIKSLCWFTYDLDGWEHYNLTDNSQARSDFQWTTANTNYTAP